MRHVASAFLLSALALALLGTGVPAAAEPTEAQLGAIKSNCRSDFMSNCWGVKRGGVEAFQCLKEHMAKLSSGCQTAVKAATPPAPAAVKTPSAPAAPAPAPAAAAPAAPATPEPAAPAAAVTAPPPAETKAATPEAAPASPAKAATPAATPPAPAAAVKTEAPATETPAPATAAAPAAPEAMPPIIGFIPPRKKLMVQRHCREDLKTYCADIDLGDGRILRCLLSNRASLTPDCQGALAKLSQ